jgi:hypothetical protein
MEELIFKQFLTWYIIRVVITVPQGITYITPVCVHNDKKSIIQKNNLRILAINFVVPKLNA